MKPSYVNLVYNWAFNHLKGSDILKKSYKLCNLSPPIYRNEQWNYCLKTLESAKLWQISRPHLLPPFYVAIIKICPLCYDKCITHVIDDLSFIKFLKSWYTSYTIQFFLFHLVSSIISLLLMSFVLFQSVTDV